MDGMKQQVSRVLEEEEDKCEVGEAIEAGAGESIKEIEEVSIISWKDNQIINSLKEMSFKESKIKSWMNLPQKLQERYLTKY